MATTVFLWEGKSRQGSVQKGEISANNKEEVMTLLRKQNITPVNVTAKPREIKLGFGEPKVTDKDVVILTRQLATMIDAGLPLIQCLEILGSQTENKTLAKVTVLKTMRELTIRTADEVQKAYRTRIAYTVGTMIELPRAAITADEIATQADFFSFGTNDLTQTAFGLSRDDAGRFLPFYVVKAILDNDPFISLDPRGVGLLMQIGVEKGRTVKKNLKMGICGEHGGDPKSVEFCHKIGLDYVSCSPYRVPIARLSAAPAALKAKSKGDLAKSTVQGHLIIFNRESRGFLPGSLCCGTQKP